MDEPNRYLMCVQNQGYEIDLEVRKVYKVISDPDGATHGLVRVVDESGEDYLFPEDYFVPVEVPGSAAKAFKDSA